MRISARGEYAIRAMLDLSLQPPTTLVSIQEIASRQTIPQRYLEQVLLALKRAGLVESKRGAAGGYHLAKPADDITVGEALRAVEGPPAPFDGMRGPRRGSGHRGDDLAELREALARAVSGVVDHLTFGELASRAAARRGAGRPMYHI
jgi:Rrf2 family protein